MARTMTPRTSRPCACTASYTSTVRPAAGPLTWRLLPGSAPATRPPTMPVTSPSSGGTPGGHGHADAERQGDEEDDQGREVSRQNVSRAEKSSISHLGFVDGTDGGGMRGFGRSVSRSLSRPVAGIPPRFCGRSPRRKLLPVANAGVDGVEPAVEAQLAVLQLPGTLGWLRSRSNWTWTCRCTAEVSALPSRKSDGVAGLVVRPGVVEPAVVRRAWRSRVRMEDGVHGPAVGVAADDDVLDPERLDGELDRRGLPERALRVVDGHDVARRTQLEELSGRGTGDERRHDP